MKTEKELKELFYENSDGFIETSCSDVEPVMSVDAFIELITGSNLCNKHFIMNWVAYDFDNVDTRPKKYGKYFICRKDGKVHWETWNGSGWAYNHNVIRFWAEIKPPCL